MSGSRVSGEAPQERQPHGVSWGRAASQPRPSGRDKPGDIAGESKNSGEPSVPGLADWLLGVVAVLPTTVRLARSCSGAPVVDA